MTMPFDRKILLVALGTIAFMALSSPAQATLLLPGTTVVPDPITLTGSNPGTFLAGDIDAWSTPGGVSGTLHAAVYRTAGNTLDFYYQVWVDADPEGTGGATRVNFQSFAGFMTDVYARSDDPNDPAAPADDPLFTTGEDT